eukprot:5541164-Prymnesium_polylepis.2
MTKAPRSTTSSSPPSCVSICRFVLATPSPSFVDSSKPNETMRFAHSTCRAAHASPRIVVSARSLRIQVSDGCRTFSCGA